MSGTFLVSPGPLLEIVSKEVKNRLALYPGVAMTRENIEKIFEKLQKLFNGGYRPVRFQSVKLHSCIMGFCECLMIFIKDSTDIQQKDNFYNMDRWMAILDNLGSLGSIRNKFIFFKPILLNQILDDLPPWFYKEFMIHLNRIFETTNELAVFQKEELKSLFRTVSRWLKLIMTCGDYEFQTIIVRNIIIICEKHHIENVFKHQLRNTGDTFKTFLAVYSQKDYVNDLQLFLSSINDNFHKVHSVPCTKVTLQKTVIPPLKGINGDVTWMHINYGFRTFSFSCHPDSLRSLPGSDVYSNVFEFVAVHFEDVEQVCLLINNDSKTDNSAVGTFVMKLSGKCSCRFNSSREMISLIKEIVVMVPNGVHLKFLKEELVKLFGKKFKEDVQTPIKRAKWLGKKHSRSNSLSQNLSFSAENRRRMKKHTDSMTSSQGSFLMPSLESYNSYTLENKENVSEDSKEFFKNSTGMHSNSNIMKSSSSNCLISENININVNQTKEDKIVTKSKSANCAVKTNLTLKINSKNKDNLEDSKYCHSISPNTGAHLGKKTDSIIASYSTKQSFKAKTEENICEDITKRNSLFLKNSDSGISTFKTEENITNNSKIFLHKEGEMEIPSNYRFGEDNSLSILEKNRDSIFDFSNTQLSPFPDFNISSKETSTQFKTESMNSSLISTNSSVYKTMSNAKSYGLDLNLSRAPSPSNERLVKDLKKILNLPEMTIKLKQNSASSGISNNSLECLPTNLPKIKNKEQSRSPLNVKLEMSDSYTFQNTDENTWNRSKGLISPARDGIHKRNDHIYALENTELINEKVFDDEIVKGKENKDENSEIFKDGQIVEESEYYSIVTNSDSTEEITESNYSEAFSLYVEKNRTLMELFNMNTEDIKNVKIVNMKKDEYEGDENDDLLTDNQTVNVAESECCSINPGDTVIENNLGKLCNSPNIACSDLNTAELKKFPKFDHKKEAIKKENKINYLLLGQQESEYYSCDSNIISTEDNEVCEEDIKICNSETPDLNFTLGSNASITTQTELTKISASYALKNITEQLTENEDSTNLELTVQQVNSSKESEYFSIASDDQGINQLSEHSETPDLDFILANIVSPHVDSKNVNMNISTAHANELIKRDHSYTFKNTKEQVLVEEEMQKNDNLIITDFQRIKCVVGSCPNANSINVNENISNPSNIRLSTKTVKTDDNWDFPENILEGIIPCIENLHTNEDQESDDDNNISVISISSTEEIDSYVEFSNSSTKAIHIQDGQNIFSQRVRNDQIENKCFTEEQIKKKRYDDMVETMKDMKNLQLPDNIQAESEKQTDMFDSCTLQNTDEIVDGKKLNENKSMISQVRVGIHNRKEPIKIDHNYALENTKLINEEVFGDVIAKDEENKAEDSEVFTEGQIVEESEYNSVISTEDNNVCYIIRNSATPDLNLNLGSNVNNATPNMGTRNHRKFSKTHSLEELVKICDSYTRKHMTKQLIENKKSQNLELMVEQVNFPEESKCFSIASDYQGTNQLSERSETPDLDFILASCGNIVSPHIESKNVNTNISTTHENEIIKRDHSYTLKNTEEQVLDEEEIQKNDNLNMIDFQGSKCIVGSCGYPFKSIAELNTNNENVNEEINNTTNIRPSTEKVIDNWDFPGNILKEIIPYVKYLHTNKDQDNNDDNISVISISSTEEIDSDVEFSNSSTKGTDIQDVQKLFSKIVRNNQIKKKSFTETPIEYNQFEDMVKTMKDKKNMLIPDITQDESENQKEIDNRLPQYYVDKTNADVSEQQFNVISTPPTERSISGSELGDKATGIHFPKYIENEHSYFAEKIEITMQYDNIAKSDADMEKTQTAEMIKSIENDHCYYFNQTLPHEVENKNVVKISNDSSGSIDKLSMHGSKEINEFNTDHLDFGLTQFIDVPILLKQIDFQQKFDQRVENDVVDLHKTKSDISLTYLLDRHQLSLDEINTSTENLENSFTLMNSKSMEQVSSKDSCDKQSKLTNAHFAQNKIKILSNIRIAPPFNAKIHQSHKDDQLADEKYASGIDELRETNAKLAHTMQTEAPKSTFNLQTKEAIENRSIEGKRKLTQEHKTPKYKDNPEVSKKRNDKINSFQEFMESTSSSLPDNNFLLDKFMRNVEGKSLQDQSNLIDNEIFEISDDKIDYIQKVHNTQGLPAKKFLLNKFYTSLKESTKSTCKTNISTEIDFEMLIPRNEGSNPEELELSLKILSPQKSLFDVIAARERKDPIQLTRKLQKPKETDYFEKFLSFLSNTSSSSDSGEKENTMKLSQDDKRSDFEKLKMQKKKRDDYEEFALTLQSKKRLPDEAATSNTEKRRKLLDGVQLSEKMHEDKKNSFEELTSKKLPFRNFNEYKESTPDIQLTQIKQKSKVNDWEMIETDNGKPYHFKEFVSIRKASEKSFATSKSEKKGVNFIKKYELPQLNRGEQVQERNLIKEVQSVSRKQKSKETNYEKLEVINEEEFRLPTKKSIAGGSELNRSIDFDWDDFKIGKENNDRLYNILNHPRRVYKICDKTGEVLKFGKPVGYKGKEVKNDKEFDKVADSIYGFDAMLFALRSYLKTSDSSQKKNRKPQKKKITKMKLFVPTKAKRKSKTK